MNIKLFAEKMEKHNLKIEGIIVFQRGRECARHRWTPEQPRTVYSVSKSFVSIAVGMAIDEGKLRLSDRVTHVFQRQKPDSRWDSLTLEHLLTMTMGHAEFSRPKTVKEALSYELDADPGTCFFYDNTCTFLASCMVTKATGLNVRDYLLDRLFRPLGIDDPQWPESDDGYTIGSTGLMLTTSQMSVFGRFLLQRGNWEGRQLASAAWIDGATRTHVPTYPAHSKPDNDQGYGYQFWTCRYGAYRCDGKNGQFIIVFPALDAVVSINAEEENQQHILWNVWDYILPQLKEACTI